MDITPNDSHGILLHSEWDYSQGMDSAFVVIPQFSLVEITAQGDDRFNPSRIEVSWRGITKFVPRHHVIRLHTAVWVDSWKRTLIVVHDLNPQGQTPVEDKDWGTYDALVGIHQGTSGLLSHHRLSNSVTLPFATTDGAIKWAKNMILDLKALKS